MFSGKENPNKDARTVFFCYALPVPAGPAEKTNGEENVWSVDRGYTRWYYLDLDNERIIDESSKIIELVRSSPATARRVVVDKDLLVKARKKVESHIMNTYLRQVLAPVGVKPTLKAWMELN